MTQDIDRLRGHGGAIVKAVRDPVFLPLGYPLLGPLQARARLCLRETSADERRDRCYDDDPPHGSPLSDLLVH